MKTYEATEQAYKNGYEKGKQDAVKQCNNIKEYLDYAIHNPNGEACEYETKEDYNRAFQAEFDRLYNLVSTPNQWISVKDRLPEENERVLACYINPLRKDRPPRMMVGEGTSTQIVKGKTYLWCGGWRSITHWMPLPEPPKGE